MTEYSIYNEYNYMSILWALTISVANYHVFL